MLSSTYQVSDPQADPQDYAHYLAQNAKTFSALDYGTSDSTLRSKVNKYRTTKDGREAFPELNAYQKGQGSKETCAERAWQKLNALKLTPTYPGGVEAFLGK